MDRYEIQQHIHRYFHQVMRCYSFEKYERNQREYHDRINDHTKEKF